MNRLRSLFALVAFSLVVLALPAIASAQWRDRDDDYGNRRNNGGYNGNYNRNLNSTVRNLKNRSRNFERVLDRALDRSRYDGRRREDNLNELAERFKEAADRLDKSYGNDRDYDRSADEARRVLDLGSQIDRVIGRARLDYSVQNEWNAIQQDLNVLSNAYGYNNQRNNRGNRNRNGNWRNNVPFPLPF